MRGFGICIFQRRACSLALLYQLARELVGRASAHAAGVAALLLLQLYSPSSHDPSVRAASVQSDTWRRRTEHTHVRRIHAHTRRACNCVITSPIRKRERRAMRGAVSHLAVAPASR